MSTRHPTPGRLANPPAPCSGLAGLTNLRELSLAGNEQLTQQGLNSVAACTQLSKLSLELCTGVKSLDMIAVSCDVRPRGYWFL